MRLHEKQSVIDHSCFTQVRLNGKLARVLNTTGDQAIIATFDRSETAFFDWEEVRQITQSTGDFFTTANTYEA
jgi:hypothetical protein